MRLVKLSIQGSDVLRSREGFYRDASLSHKSEINKIILSTRVHQSQEGKRIRKVKSQKSVALNCI